MKTLKVISLFVLIIIAGTCAVFAQQQTDKKPAADYSGTWKYEKKVKPDKKNKNKIELISFSIEIKQEGQIISGRYEYTTTNATRIREGIINGKIFGIKAVVKFENPEYTWENGLAELVPSKDGMNWIIIQIPKGDNYLPVDIVLKKGK